MMSALLFSLAFAKQVLQEPVVQDDAPIVRFGGRNSTFLDEDDLRKGFKLMPKHPPEPQYLTNFTLGFTNYPNILPIFDDTYRPWRALLAKRQLIEMMLEGDPRRAFVISKLFFAQYSEISDQLDAVIPTYVFDQQTCVSFTVRLDIEVKLPRSTVPVPPISEIQYGSDPTEKEAMKTCATFPLHRNDAHEQEVFNLNAKYGNLATVKIWGRTEANPAAFENLQKQALKIYDTWSQEEGQRIDQLLYDHLERTKVWPEKPAIYRCKVFGDLEKSAPGVYKSMLENLSKNYERYGFPNADSFREGARAAPLKSTTGFIAHVCLSDGRNIEFPIL